MITFRETFRTKKRKCITRNLESKKKLAIIINKTDNTIFC